MQGREFLDLAREIVTGATEVHWRGACGRAYYSLVLECREAFLRWGIKIPPRDNMHAFVRLRFIYSANPELKDIGYAIERLVNLRNNADYNLSSLASFNSSKAADDAIQDASDCIDLLVAIDNDPTRRSAAIAAIKKTIP